MKKNYTIYAVLLLLFQIALSISAADVVKWIFETGDRVIATPVIRNDSLFIGSLNGNFYAINAIDGTELWHYTAGNEIRTTAALYENIICFESGNVLYGLNMDGSLLWTDTLYDGSVINEHDEWDCFRSSPELLDSIAYIGSEEGLVFGVNVKTGERVFETQTPEANITIETTPAIFNNKIYVGDWYGVLSVFDLTTQNLLWQYDTKDDNTYSWVNAIVSQPLIYRDTLYFGGRSCNLYALNPETGEKLWMYHQPGNMWLFGGPVVSDDVLYMGSSYQQVVYAFSPDEPELFWETSIYGKSYGYPVVHDDYILLGTGSFEGVHLGSLTIVNKQTHEIAERFNVDGWVETPLYHEGIIYFGCADGNVYAINEQNLLNTLRPNTVLQDENPINLGQLSNSGSIETSFYLKNIGAGKDSLTDITSCGFTSIDPETIILNPTDSVEVNVLLDLSDLSPGELSIYIRYHSHYSMIPETVVSKLINMEIIDAVSLDNFEDSKLVTISESFPNPTIGLTSFNYLVDKECFVQLDLFDMLGNRIVNLINETRPKGKHSLQFDTSILRAGTYLYVFKADNLKSTGKIVVLDRY